ncbi:hypothetical protein AX17_004266 [Amanita inopinata Kibby_2008]|nr:hypothetical protein AX17_004266 [Amanita inopinata Kibby_2008]
MREGSEATCDCRYCLSLIKPIMPVLQFLLLLLSTCLSVNAACSPAVSGTGSSSSTFWMADASLHNLGTSPFNTNPDYKVFRNVQTDFGAKGDGVNDDTAAINMAINATGRCGQGCNSTTITPAVVYFPPGNYRVTSPIIPFYFTSLVGDYNNKPTLIADANFNGIAVIDADPYIPGGNGANWWTNQNNFFRSVRNFVIDVTAMPPSVYGTGIHWQVGQATSLINIDFHMSSASGTKHQGIFMENGSGGFMSDLTFTGGAFGMWVSNQQFTIRNVKISGAVSAIYQLWNWGFTWQNIQITGCQVGFDLATGGLTLATQSAGGVVILDSSISNTAIGVRTSTSQPSSLGGSIVLDNVEFSGITTANVQDSSGTVMAASSTTVEQWFEGNVYSGTANGTYMRGAYPSPPTKPTTLLDSNGHIFTRSRPQYNTWQPSQFLSVKGIGGAKGDGVTDDSDAINNFISANSGCGIIYFDAGTYLVEKTIFVPAETIIVGEMFSTILGSGSAFSSQSSPTPVLKVGNAGDKGAVEISDMVISTTGGSQGAIGIEWNIAGSSSGAAGLWDVHIRLGGTEGTNINAANCPQGSTDVTTCSSAFLGLHITPSGSGYFENLWVWNADHDLEDPAQTRINSFSGRGILSESYEGPVWLWGTASEHHVIYQYAFLNSENVYMGLIQTETPYFQPTPTPPTPFSTTSTYGDPDVSTNDAWGLVITNSFNVFIYGAGLYSFFQTYGQACVDTRDCQNAIALVDTKSAAVYIYQLTTTGTTNMLTIAPNTQVIDQAANIDGYASTATFWKSASSTVPPPVTPQYPCTLVQGWVQNWISYIMSNYWENSAGTPMNPIGCGCFNTIPQAWEEPVTIEAIINWIWATGDTQDLYLTQLVDGHFLSWSGQLPHPSPASFGGKHDDALWAALAWLKYYEYQHDVHGLDETDYLDAAKDMIDFAQCY